MGGTRPSGSTGTLGGAVGYARGGPAGYKPGGPAGNTRGGPAGYSRGGPAGNTRGGPSLRNSTRGGSMGRLGYNG